MFILVCRGSNCWMVHLIDSDKEEYSKGIPLQGFKTLNEAEAYASRLINLTIKVQR